MRIRMVSSPPPILLQAYKGLDENWYANDYPDEEESESEGRSQPYSFRSSLDWVSLGILSDDGNSYGWR